MLKRFVVMRVPETYESVMSMTPVAGLLTLEAAENIVRHATAADPESRYVIQEVGAA